LEKLFALKHKGSVLRLYFLFAKCQRLADETFQKGVDEASLSWLKIFAVRVHSKHKDFQETPAE
jgi:hypothetical protein